MPQEIEAKFLDIDNDAVRASLMRAGATLAQPMRLMQRQMFDFPDKRFQEARPGRKLRLRNEGDKMTLTYKEGRTDSPYATEIETTVGSIEATAQLLQAIGLEIYSVQESKRETWKMDDVEVVLDEWPWLVTYIEIEGPSEASIQAAAAKLGFEWSDARFGSVDTAYRAQYRGMSDADSINSLADVRFDMPLPEYFKKRMQA
jgi:adenylate cyclase class 2